MRNEPNGFGVAIFNNGDKYIGCFDKKLKHAKGKWFTQTKQYSKVILI